jgi:protein-L-isoaspartate(D-aspartate) O-methyltransferase
MVRVRIIESGNMTEEKEYTEARVRMVSEQLARRDIRNERVLGAFRAVPRHLFVPPDERHLAYIDAPLPIGGGQTISQPYIVALMTQLLEAEEGDTVLEVGTGSGYQAAILSHLTKQVYSLERIPDLAARSRRLLESLGIRNVTVIDGDGTLGYPDHAPYQGIVVTAAAPKMPEPLAAQLDEGGNLIVPVGGRYGQVLERWRLLGGRLAREQLVPVAFVPLIGKHGWSSEDTSSSWWR